MYSPSIGTGIPYMPKSNKSKSTAMVVARPSQGRISKKTKVSRKPKTQRNVQRPLDSRSSASALLAESWMNPFLRSACIPDGSNGTGCFSVKQDVQLNTGAAGSSCALFLGPIPTAYSYTDAGSTAVTPTVTGNWAAVQQLASITALYGKYRPVSCGMRGCYTGPTQTDGGVVVVGQVNGACPISNFNGTPLSTAVLYFQDYKIYPLREGFEVTWRPNDEDDVMNFITVAGSSVPVVNGFNTSYLAAIVYTAASSQSTLNCELIVNFEGQYESQSFLPGGIRTNVQPAEIGWYGKAKNMILGVPAISSFIHSSTRFFANGALQMIGNGMRGSMGNGYPSPGLLAQTGLPRLTY
jgi:hypothetical protein